MSRVIVVAAVGSARGSRAAAAALACAGSEPDRAGLLIDVGGRPPRPTVLASAAARELEERLAAHLPRLRAVSRGQTCHLVVPDDPDCFDGVRAALPLVRDSVAVLHLPPPLLQSALAEPDICPSGALLCADLACHRALTALAVGDLLNRGLAVRVLKRPLAWIPARRALFGVLAADAAGGLSARIRRGLMLHQIPVEHACYAGTDDEEADTKGTAQQQRRDYARPRRWRGLHRHPQREAGR